MRRLLCGALFFISSCSLVPDLRAVRIVFPALPAFFEGLGSLEGWFVLYPSKCGPENAEFVEVYAPVSAEGSVVLSMPAGCNLPVAAYPVFTGGYRGSFCAGGFFPFDTAGGLLRLSWADGPAADIMRRCAEGSGIYRAVNLPRLRAAMIEYAESSLSGDVWMIDREAILVRLGYGVFRTGAIKRADSRSIEITGHPGVWAAENPAAAAVEEDEAGTLRLEIPSGLPVRFFGREGAAVDLFCDAGGWFLRSSVTGASECGNW